MDNSQNTKKVIRGKLEGRRGKGRPRKRWMDSVEADLQKREIVNRKRMSEHRKDWAEAVRKAKEV